MSAPEYRGKFGNVWPSAIGSGWVVYRRHTLEVLRPFDTLEAAKQEADTPRDDQPTWSNLSPRTQPKEKMI